LKTHIEQQTFSSVSAFSFSNDVFTSAFDNYRIMITTTTTASPATLQWRGRVAGTDTSSSNYVRQTSSISSATYSASRATETTGFLGDIFSAGPNVVTMDIFGPKLTQRTLVQADNLNSDFGARIFQTGIIFNLTTSFDSISILCSTGNITGKASLYGYRN
jgi:hypothetical protein